MGAILAVIAAAVVIIFIDVPALLNQKRKKELRMFGVLLLCGVGLSIAEALDWYMPNPLDWIAVMYKPLSDLLYGMLK